MANQSHIQVTMTGVPEIDRTLRTLPKRMKKKLLISAYRKAGRLLVKNARSRIPVNQGDLRKSIGVVAWKNTEGNEATVRIGPRRKKGSANMQGWHSHLIEYGTKDREPRKGKTLVFEDRSGNLIFPRRVRGLRPTPFMQPAIAATKDKIREKIRVEIGNALVKQMKKTLGRALR